MHQIVKNIIDLKDKIALGTSVSMDFQGENNSVKQEALYAFEKLGFSIKKMQPIVDKILYENQNLSVEEVIKIALKTL